MILNFTNTIDDLWFRIEVDAENRILSLFDLFLGAPLHKVFNEITDAIWDAIFRINVAKVGIKENVNWTWIVYSCDGNTYIS
jgi:hypothetical protein